MPVPTDDEARAVLGANATREEILTYQLGVSAGLEVAGSAAGEVTAPSDPSPGTEDGTSSDPSAAALEATQAPVDAPVEPQGPEAAPVPDPEEEARQAAYAAATQLLENAGYTVTPPNPLP